MVRAKRNPRLLFRSPGESQPRPAERRNPRSAVPGAAAHHTNGTNLPTAKRCRQAEHPNSLSFQQSSVHSQTLPRTSYSPKGFGWNEPTGAVYS